jgi:hypothetical protein
LLACSTTTLGFCHSKAKFPNPNAVVPALGAASLPEHHESAAEDFRIQLPWGRVFCRQNAIPV